MKTSVSVSQRRRRLYYGWVIVLACGIIAFFSWGLGFYGLGVYLDALRSGRGWPTNLISLAVTVYYLAGAAGSIAVGSLIERFGPRAVIAGGALAMGLSVAGLGFITEPWHLFALSLLLAVGWACLGATGISGTLLPWFQRRRGLALTIALTGPSLGGMVLVPLLVFLIQRDGFAAAMIFAGGLLLACLLPLAAFVLKRPSAESLPADEFPSSTATRAGRAERAWSRAAVLRAPLFWTLALPFALALIVQVGFLVHQLTLLSAPLGTAQAAFAVSATTVAALVGRLAVGVVYDRGDGRWLSAGIFAVQGAALALLALTSWPGALYLGSVAFGLGVGNVITLPPLLVAEEYGARAFATVFALVYAVMQLGVAFGPSVVGIVRDAWGGYQTALWLLVALEAVAVAGILAGKRPGKKSG